jgi:hypothetical protein
MRQLNDPAAGFSRRSSATPMVSTSPPNNLSDHEPWPNLTASTSTCPASPTNPPGLRSGSPDRPRRRNRQASTPLPTEAASGRDLSTAGDMAAVLYWRLTALPTPEADRCPGSTPSTRDSGPSACDNYLTKRAQHVADLAGRFETSQPEPVISQSGLGREATRAPHSSAT